MTFIEDLINNDERFPFGDGSNEICERYFNNPNEPADRNIWIRLILDAVNNSKNPLKEFGVQDNEVINPSLFAYKFSQITGYTADPWARVEE